MKIKALDDLKKELKDDARFGEEYAARVRADAAEFAFDEPIIESGREDKSTYDLIDEASAALAHDGRDYIAALCWMATCGGFTHPSISLLLAVAAYENCKEQDERGCEITDSELAEFKGCSERTIQRWRNQYKKEEKYLKVPFLRITEGDFDKGLNANRPTRYRFLIDTGVADAVLEARQMTLYQEDRRKALKLSAIRVYDSLAKPIGQSAIHCRRKRVLPLDSERNRLVNTIRTSVAKLKDISSRMDGEFDWEGLKREMASIYNSANPFQVVAEIKRNPMGRQSVAPSIPDVAVSKDMPTDAPVSEYLKVPSIAREVRRTSRSQEGARYG